MYVFFISTSGRKVHIDDIIELEAMDANDDGKIDYWEMQDWIDEKHAFNLHNSLLYSLASLFEQGGERHPRSWSGITYVSFVAFSHLVKHS